jgi:cysteine-rich repeat protein
MGGAATPVGQDLIDPDTSCPACGDGVREGGDEACDDGNVANGDGCSADCKSWEQYYICSDESATGGPDICTLTLVYALDWDFSGSGSYVSTVGSVLGGVIFFYDTPAGLGAYNGMTPT